jgi:transposase
MTEVTIIGVDLAKRVFQLHGAMEDGSVVFRRKLSPSAGSATTIRRPETITSGRARPVPTATPTPLR